MAQLLRFGGALSGVRERDDVPQLPMSGAISLLPDLTGVLTPGAVRTAFVPIIAGQEAIGIYSEASLGNEPGGPVTVTWVGMTLAPSCGSVDFNCDGDLGTDADIEAFFACLAGNCPPQPCSGTADFNGDGDLGTDADIAAFFRVLGGGSC